MRVGGGLGIGGVLLLGLLSLVFQQDFLSMVPGVSEAPHDTGGPVESTPEEDRLVEFVSFVLDDAQQVWRQKFGALGEPYQDAKLVLFRGAVESACGVAQSAAGPFYCPADQKAYIDLGFYEELRQRFGAPGDFAQAYVLAHEIGHHVQHLLGIDREVRRAQQGDPSQANEYSVRMELQADCFAGVWGHSTERRDRLEAGDVEEALDAAAAIGDDRIQRSSGGGVNPESFTHGSSAQRVEWFRRGMQSGTIEACNTFGTGG